MYEAALGEQKFSLEAVKLVVLLTVVISLNTIDISLL